MKKLARLIFFFCSWFMVVFLFTAAIQCLLAWVNAARAVPAGSGNVLQDLISGVRNSLPVALYSALLLSLSYAARRQIQTLAARLLLFVLGFLFVLGISLGLSRFPDSLPFGDGGSPRTLGKPGLLLSEADTVMVLLGDPAIRDGSRVVSLPGRSLIYQEVPRGPENTILRLPPVSFNQDTNFLLTNLLVDISLAAGQFRTRLQEGMLPFTLYAGALIFLLLSLDFVLHLSLWPLANLFWGALAFRGVLALEGFLNSRDIQEFIASFLDHRLPGSLMSPLVFLCLGLLLSLLTLLWSFAWGRRAVNEN
ncbi:MAG: hypothetical protein LBL19_08555 [Spirochaetaceae bacterium]|nr:hypothetical protein [Spirochaetaceae bacterium]